MSGPLLGSGTAPTARAPRAGRGGRSLAALSPSYSPAPVNIPSRCISISEACVQDHTLTDSMSPGTVIISNKHLPFLWLFFLPYSRAVVFYFFLRLLLRNEEGSGSVQLLGIKTSVIKHNGLSWQMEDSGWIVSKNTTAISEAPFSSFVLGSQNWTITNDNKTCSTKGESYRRRLKLTGCLVGNFTCDDGQCIRSYKLSHVSNYVIRHQSAQLIHNIVVMLGLHSAL